MYQMNQGNDNTEKLKTTVLYVKIGLAIAIFILGAYVIIWSLEIIDQIVNAKNTSIIKTVLDLGSDQQSFSISFSGDRLVIENNDAFNFIFLLFIFIVLFNIVGRAISGIFKCLASIIVGLNVNTNESKEKNKNGT